LENLKTPRGNETGEAGGTVAYLPALGKKQLKNLNEFIEIVPGR
jgi:hypothetical protein